MLLLLFAGLLILLFVYSKRNHTYWADRNIKHDKPVPLFGNHFRNVFWYKSVTEISEELYNKYPDEKVIGYYRGNTPELIIRHPDLVRQILNIDFMYFHRRGFFRKVNDPLLLNLFHVDGDAWKLLRQRLTGAFTTSKLRSMFPLVVRCAEKLQTVAGGLAARGEEYDVRELMARFTTEFIGVCGFGIEMDTINNEDCQFRKLGKLILKRHHINFVGIMEIFPILRKILVLKRWDIIDPMLKIFTNIRKQRNFKPIGRNDFVDLLLEMEMKGKLEGDSIEKRNPDSSPVHVEMELDVECMMAQLFVFFVAGFETSSHATSITLHHLAYNPEIQTKIQEEIDRVLLKYDNKLCYDAIAEMSLLYMAFKESLRILPSLGCLNRLCVKKYTIPGLNVTIDPGVKILIPVQAIQRDEKYFDSPSEFRPERFMPDVEKERHKYAYLPFGEGPRACIGSRLGEMQSLAGLALLLQAFTFEPSPSSVRKLSVYAFANVVQSVKNGVFLNIKKRNIKLV